MENEFSVVVHYRYVINNEVEKDFAVHSIFAESEEDAKSKAMLLYSGSRGRIPFKVEML